MSVLYQALCTFIVCWIRMSLSITFSWPAFTVELFKSDHTPLHRPMTAAEAALFGSMSSIGAVIFTPVGGFLLDVLGRKKCMILGASCHVLTWSIIVVTNRVEALLAGMFIAGAGIGSFVVIPVYIAEVCQASVRGTMTSCMLLAFGLGMLSSYLLGGYMQYTSMCYICLAIAVLGALMTLTLKESPVFLMGKGREEEAVKAMAFYRQTTADDKIVMQEIDAIRKTLGGVKEVATKEEIVETETVESVSCWKFFNSSQSTKKATRLVLVLMVCSMFHGYVVVCVYAGLLFEKAVPSLPPVLCSVMMAIVTIAANLLSAFLVDVLGRRPLMLYSSLASGVCCVLLGSQLQLYWGPHIMTAVVIFIFCFVYNLGAGAIPFVLAAEVFLPKISSKLSMITYEIAWICTFIVLFAFPPLEALLGLNGLFYLFAIICFLTVGFSAYHLPETKLLTVDEIQKLF